MKKGVISAAVFQWIVLRLPMLIVSFIALYAIINVFTIADVNIMEGEMEILSKRILYNIYDKDIYTGRVAVGVVDPLQMIDERRLLDLISYPDDKFIAAKMALAYENQELVGYFSKHWYERWKPIAEARLRGKIAESKSFRMPVTITDVTAFAIAQKKQFLAGLGAEPDPQVVAKVEDEIQALEKKGFGGMANGVLTFDLVKPQET